MTDIYSGDLTITNNLNVGSNINSTGLINGNNAVFNSIITDELTINTNITTNIQNFTTETIVTANQGVLIKLIESNTMFPILL
jgi:hypothetical protein